MNPRNGITDKVRMLHIADGAEGNGTWCIVVASPYQIGNFYNYKRQRLAAYLYKFLEEV